MNLHFSMLDRFQMSSALTRKWRELSEMISELEMLNQDCPHIALLKRAQDDVNSAEIHFSKYHGRAPKGLFASRNLEADDDVRFIAGTAYDLANLIGQFAQYEIDTLRKQNA